MSSTELRAILPDTPALVLKMNAESSVRHHQVILRAYLTDMIALEKDISQAVEGQILDERMHAYTEVQGVLRIVAGSSVARKNILSQLSGDLEGDFGTVVKEAVATATGTLTGLYALVRKHPVSRMLRDDHAALNLAATSYGILYATAVAFEDEEIAEAALEHLNELPPQILEVGSLIPEVVVAELMADDATINREAVAMAAIALENAWSKPPAGRL